MLEYGNELSHYGVKGMKWGVRRARSKSNYSKNKTVRKQQKTYDKAVRKNWHEAYNKAAEHSTKVIIPKLNEKYQKKYGNDWFKEASKNNSAEYQKYRKEYDKLFQMQYNKEFKAMFGERPK